METIEQNSGAGDDTDTELSHAGESGGIFDAFNSAFPDLTGDDDGQDADDGSSSSTPEKVETPAKEPAAAKPAPVKKVEGEIKIDEAEEFLALSEEKKEEELPTEEDFDKETAALSQGMDTKAHKKFQELRQELKAYKLKKPEDKAAEVPVDIQEKIKDLELKAAEAEGLRQKVDELSNVSAQVKVENSKEYEVKVLQPAAKILGTAKKFAEDNGVEFEVVQDIIREGDKKVQAELIKMHLADVSEIDKQDLYQMIYGFKSVTEVREGLLADASKKLTEIEAEAVRQQEEQRAQERKNIQTIQSGMWDKYLPIIPGLTDEEGKPTDAYTNLRNRSLAVDYSKAAGKEKAYATFAGVLLPHVVEQLNDALGMLREYTGKEHLELRRRPKLGGPTDDSNSDEDEDFLTKMRKQKFK